MQKILEQLYTGNLYPYSKFRTTIEQFRVNRDKAYRLYTSFSKKLPEELREEFNELIDSQICCPLNWSRILSKVSVLEHV